MKFRDLVDLTTLAALWGASFLFIRVAAPEFGPIALMELRVVIAAAFLLVMLAMRGRLQLLRTHAWPLTLVGTINSALPFCLIAYATLSVTAGFAAILNATTPLWGALIAWLWLKDRLTPWRVVGLAIGFAGMLVLTWDKLAVRADASGIAVRLAILAGLGGALSYGLAASYTKKSLTGVDPLALATGSQVGAALVLTPLAPFFWPAHSVSAAAWLCVIALGIACTGIAYILYFRLIANVGPSKAITVTFLVPVFAIVWGSIWLGEQVNLSMLVGGVIVLMGTALSTGLVKPFSRS